MRLQPNLTRPSVRPALMLCFLLLSAILLLSKTTDSVQSATLPPTRTARPSVNATRQVTSTAEGTAAVTPAETTPTIDPAKLLVNPQSDILFPSWIRFIVDVGVPTTQVKAAQVTVTEGSFRETITLPLKLGQDIFILTNQTTRLDWAWPLAGHEKLQLFQAVRYQWQVTLKSGQTAKLEHTFQYQDNTSKLIAYRIDPSVIYAPQSLVMGNIIGQVQAAQQLIGHDTGITLTQVFAVYPIGLQLCSTDPNNPNQPILVDHFDGHSFPCDPSESARLYAGSNVNLLMVTALSLGQISDDLITRMATNAYNQLWGLATATPAPSATESTPSGTASVTATQSPAATSSPTAGNSPLPPPDWFRTGIAKLYGSNQQSGALAAVRTAAQTDTLFALPDLIHEPTFSPALAIDSTLWESQSYLLTLYLNTKYGSDTAVRIARQIAAQPGDFTGALNSVIGTGNMADLMAAWQTWLFTPDADAALNYSPYPTATPLAQATAAEPTGTQAATTSPATSGATTDANLTDNNPDNNPTASPSAQGS